MWLWRSVGGLKRAISLSKIAYGTFFRYFILFPHNHGSKGSHVYDRLLNRWKSLLMLPLMRGRITDVYHVIYVIFSINLFQFRLPFYHDVLSKHFCLCAMHEWNANIDNKLFTRSFQSIYRIISRYWILCAVYIHPEDIQFIINLYYYPTFMWYVGLKFSIFHLLS